MARIETCQTCRFFEPPPEHAAHLDGECHAHPPSPQSNRLPTVAATDWCGEWQSTTIQVQPIGQPAMASINTDCHVCGGTGRVLGVVACACVIYGP